MRKNWMFWVAGLEIVGAVVGAITVDSAAERGVLLAIAAILAVAILRDMRQVATFAVLLFGALAAILAPLFWLEGAASRWASFAAFHGLVTALALNHGFRLPEDYLKRWSKSHGVTITDENRSVIHPYLLRGRRFRTVGALAGYISYGVVDQLGHGIDLPIGWVTFTFTGYLLGAAAAEIWAARPERGTVRVASLTPRRLTDYIPRYAVVLMRAVPIATIALAVAYPVIPTRPELASFEGIERRPDPWSVVGWTAAAVALWLLVEWTARRIVDKPQPAVSDDLVFVDDTIRSTALHGLIGAGLALMLGAFGRAVGNWQSLIGPMRLDGLFGGVSIVAGLGTIFVWLHLGIDQPWVMRRVRPATPPAEKVQTA